MGLISMPPQTHIEFKQSLVHSMLTIIGLLHQSNRLEGLSDWIQNTSGRVETQNKNILNGIATILLFANGVQGFLVNNLSGNASTSFSYMMDDLEALDSNVLQTVVIESLMEWAKRWDLIDGATPIPSSADTMYVLLEKIQQFREDNWQLDSPPMALRDFANLIYDAETLHDHFLMSFEYLWHHFYAQRWDEDSHQEQEAVHYHRLQQYPTDLTTVFRAVTGRTMPARLHDYQLQIRRVTMIPSCHIGAYVIVSIRGQEMWIGFNANLVSVNAADSTAPIAELYPVLKALADEVRLKIVAYLRQNGEQNVSDITDALHLTTPTTSRHLNLLARTGILDMRKDGTMRYYALNPQALTAIGSSLQQLATEKTRI